MVTEVIPGARSVALGIMVEAGSRFESPSQHGAAHLLEHLLFRGATGFDSDAIASSLDRFGGESNAVTDKETMTAYVRTLPELTHEALFLLCAVTTTPSLDETLVAAERSVVLDELLSRDDEPSDITQVALDASLFGDHPLGRDVLGTVDSLGRLDAQALRSFHEATYGSDRMVVAAAGAVDHDAVVRTAQASLFGSTGLPLAQHPPEMRPSSLRVVEHPSAQQHLAVGIQTPGISSPDVPAMGIAAHLLGGGVSSRLFREIRDRRGLAYGVGADLLPMSDVGVLVAYGATAASNIDEVVDLMGQALDEAAGGSVSTEEFARSKEAVRADLLLSADEPLSRVGRLGGELLVRGEVRSIEDRAEELSGVDIDDVARALERFGSAPRHWVVVGQTSDRTTAHLSAMVASSP